MAHRRPWWLGGAARWCAGRLRPRLAQANGSTAPRSSGDSTSAKIGLGGVCSGSLATERPMRRRSLLRRGSPAGDLRAVTVGWGRIRDTMRRREDNAEQRGHGGALISLGHGELSLRRGAGHGGVTELAIGLSPSHGHNCGELERVEQCGTLLCARAISPGWTGGGAARRRAMAER